jgi:hypothetical protein
MKLTRRDHSEKTLCPAGLETGVEAVPVPEACLTFYNKAYPYWERLLRAIRSVNMLWKAILSLSYLRSTASCQGPII